MEYRSLLQVMMLVPYRIFRMQHGEISSLEQRLSQNVMDTHIILLQLIITTISILAHQNDIIQKEIQLHTINDTIVTDSTIQHNLHTLRIKGTIAMGITIRHNHPIVPIKYTPTMDNTIQPILQILTIRHLRARTVLDHRSSRIPIKCIALLPMYRMA